ncbi:9939_t:CDS:2 [Acaulospora morrowiae]|uniref:9939_t:CDS:1 n=1 Tax=Acaulospora morrowiae TaxID=94023 RepID=A0A9N9BD01_9GLOM|nr:9939_t:CDS:2 [Acaulospora morrowiae]
MKFELLLTKILVLVTLPLVAIANPLYSHGLSKRDFFSPGQHAGGILFHDLTSKMKF